MKIAILGFGQQGQSAYEYWASADNEITICDHNDQAANLPTTANTQLGESYLKNLEQFDLIVRSPSIHPRDIVAANTSDILQKVTTNTNEFFKACPSQNIIGVTGTKGKGTTSTLITKLLEATDRRVHLGGNIGTPPLDLLRNRIDQQDYVVLELANFQLIDLQASPHIAICLMVVPEHLDWHENMDEYVTAKQQLFAHQTLENIAIYYADNENSVKVASVSPGHKIPYFASPGAVVEGNKIAIDGQAICQTEELKLLGEHNWQNVCAAVTAVWQISHDVVAIKSVLTNFTGLPHRLEFVRTVGDIIFYNDSFAATPDAAVAAIQAIPEMKVMIIGGFDRQLPLEEFAGAVVKNAQELRRVLLIGASAERTAEALRNAGFINFSLSGAKDMTSIIAEARQLAQPHDAIVLSPGFPSFDMFKNFEDRGLQFKEVVKKL